MLKVGTPQAKFKMNGTNRSKIIDSHVEWGFGALSAAVFYRTYSRVKEDGTMESWNDCVIRVIEGMFTILKTHSKESGISWDERKAQRLAIEAAERMFCFKWTPPGRGLWVMGTDLIWERGSASLNNPLSLDTKIFVKDSGWVALRDVIGEDVTVYSMIKGKAEPNNFTGSRGHVSAKVSHIEKHPAYRLTFKSSFGPVTTIDASENHRWYINGKFGERVDTTNLNIGDTVPRVAPVQNWAGMSMVGAMHGFFFGDGTRSNGSLFGFTDEKKALFTKLYGPAHFKETKKVLESGLVAELVDRQPLHYGKLPSDDMRKDKRYIRGFLAGYFAADGSTNGQTVKICSNNKDELLGVKGLFEELGCETHWAEEIDISSNFSEKFSRYTLIINSQDIDEHFMLNETHKRKWVGRKTDTTIKLIDKVKLEHDIEVACCTVEHHENFLIEGNIITSNCGFVSTKDINQDSIEDTIEPFEFLVSMSFYGVGVGFDTKGAGKVLVGGYDNDLERTKFVVPDTREGWVEAMMLQLKNGLFGGPRVDFDTTQIRDQGQPIKGFGGEAPGPIPLIHALNAIQWVVDRDAGTLITSAFIVDIQNITGRAIVSGGIRRVAEIALAPDEDELFKQLKDPSLYPIEMGAVPPSELKEIDPEAYENYWNDLTEISEKYKHEPWAFKFGGWRWASNNSLFGKIGETDYVKIEEGNKLNGEPGLFWLGLARQYGRLKDPADNKDYRAAGTNPCGEQTLESYELCCLVENFPAHHEDYWDFQRTLKFSYLYAKAVTLLGTHNQHTNNVMNRNRRIGSSMTGITEAIAKHGRHKFMHEFCDQGFEYIRRTDRKYSDWLGVRESIRRNSVKPSGTISLLGGAAGPGVHYPKMLSGYRIMQMSKDAPVVKPLRDAGYRIEASVYNPQSTVAVYFPWIVEGDVKTDDQASIWEKTKLVADMQYFWADNQVSNTITFSPEESNDIANVITAFEGQLKSVSFLPLSGGNYKQMPFTTAPLDEIIKYRATLAEVDWDTMIAGVDLDGQSSNSGCDGDSCEVSFSK